MPEILDSGARREFETGAVRDIQEGKGRMDLIPLDVLANFLVNHGDDSAADVVQNISYFKDSGEVSYLTKALAIYVYNNSIDVFDMVIDLSKHFEAGAKKYGEDNWQKGIPVHCYIDSALRHYFKHLRGDTDEPHVIAFVWNMFCCIWTCTHKADLNDYAR